jgi:PAS domain S-box-containing protein
VSPCPNTNFIMSASRSKTGSSKDVRPELKTGYLLGSIEAGLPDGRISLDSMIDGTAEAALFVDQDNTIRCWNTAAQNMFQYSKEDVLGKDVEFLLPFELRDSGELDRLRTICAEEGVVHNYITRRVRKDGTQVRVSLTHTDVHDEEGASMGSMTILRDISMQRSGDCELRKSCGLAMVGELAAKVAHEVKNPLAGIFAALQVLEGSLESTDPRREVFASIGDEVTRLNSLTQNLLNFARPAAPELESCNLCVFLTDLVQDLERLSMIPPGLVKIDLGPTVWVGMDLTLSREVFKNLLLNAGQVLAGRSKRQGEGRIFLRATASDTVVSVSVEDNGPGIPAEERARIFEPFFTTRTKGTGLGLAIARKNMEAQDGGLRLSGELDTRDSGATFLVDFPR